MGLKAASRLYALLAPHLSHIEHRGRLFERRLDANVLTRLSIRLFADNFPFSIVSAIQFLIYHIQLAEILESGRIRRENPGMDGNCDGLRLSLSKDKSAIPLLSSSSKLLTTFVDVAHFMPIRWQQELTIWGKFRPSMRRNFK